MKALLIFLALTLSAQAQQYGAGVHILMKLNASEIWLKPCATEVRKQ